MSTSGGNASHNLDYGAATELTIATGSITRTQTVHSVAAESGTSDNLDLIAGGAENDIIVIFPKIGHDITVRHNQTAGNANNLLLAGDANFVMDEDDNSLRLRYDPNLDTNGAWVEDNRDEISSHAEAHTVASHSDTTATGAETETLTNGSDASALHVHTVVSLDTDTTGAELTSLADGSTVSIHSHAAGAVTLSGLSEDLRDNRSLLALVDSLEVDQASDGRGSIGLGMASAIDNSATVSGVTFRGGAFDLRTGTDANAQSLISSKQLSTYGDRNPHFIAILTSRAANSALKAQGWGFMDTGGDDISNWTGTSQHKAFFRSVTTGNLFAVSGNGSNEQTTDLGGSHTLGNAGVFEVFTTNDGSSWLFHIAKSLVATHSTQVPTATTAMKVRVGIENNTTTDLRITNIDLIMAYQDRS